MKLTKKTLLASTMAAALLLSSCSSSTESSTAQGTEPSTEVDAPSIVIIGNNLTDGRGEWLREKAGAAGFNIELVEAGGGDTTARVISEVNNPTSNVVWGPTEDQFTAMIKAGSLAEYTPSWAAQVEGISEDNGYSWPYEIQPKILVANPDIYTTDTVPKNYSDLWENEEFHGKYTVPETFTGNTDRAIIGGILGQYLDPNGELGVSEEGWAAIEMYFDNGYKTPKGEDDFGNMASGKVPITYTYASGLLKKSQSFDVTPIVVYTELGEPTGTNQIGVVANSDPAIVEESKRFADWLGSAEIIGEFASNYGNLVANKDAEQYMIEEMKALKENYKPIELDWAYINSMMEQGVAKIQLEIFLLKLRKEWLKMIYFKDIEIKFGDFVAIQNLNLDVAKGEFFTFLGPSGCGKTTTLRSLVGFIEPTKGTITVEDEDITYKPIEKRGIGMVFQSYALFPTMTVKENIQFGLKENKWSKDDIEKRIDEVSKMVNLTEEQLNKNVSELSGGQQQRVAIARALALNPKIIVLDEPLSNLDAKLRKQLRVELKKIQKVSKSTMIYVTHDQEEALTLSDRIAVFNNGYVEQIGTPREIYYHPNSEFVANFIGETNSINSEILEKINFPTGCEELKKELASKSVYVRLEAVKTSIDQRESDKYCTITASYQSEEFFGMTTRNTFLVGNHELKNISSVDELEKAPNKNIMLYIHISDFMKFDL